MRLYDYVLLICVVTLKLYYCSLCAVYIQDVAKKLAPTDLSINCFMHKKSTVILHVHQLGNDSILYQVVCAVCSIKYSMVLSNKYSDVSFVY